MYKYIIFDVDGTILDTKDAVLLSLQKIVFEELGRNCSTHELSFALGITGETALKKLGITSIEGCIKRWNKYLKEYYGKVRIFDGIKETLLKLNEKKVLTGIVTSETKEEFKSFFIPFGLRNYFDIIVCADDTKKHKPYPEPILKFLELSNARKSETIYIGDTKYDLKCSSGAGTDFALALWGAQSSKGIEADYILEKPEQILELIKK